MLIYYLKALHLIFIVSWFSGLFFIGRLYVYHQQALEKGEGGNNYLIDLFKSGEKRTMYIIILPSTIITLALGSTLMYYTGAYRLGWFHFKLLLIIAFLFYNHLYGRIRKKLSIGENKISSFKLRLMNEVPFFFLVGIVFTVYLKDLFSGIWALLVLFLVVISATLMIKLLRKKEK
ncbi:protoporphyrinogen IX oxidase [Candidatus Marinamargulisbacteria bacterium SCGC AAA071-K20]|nr:protoporphyrinogen IX oxidase [Candidatus Marinamargulisbacteria bacterium SCGC AAA071-K20]